MRAENDRGLFRCRLNGLPSKGFPITAEYRRASFPVVSLQAILVGDVQPELSRTGNQAPNWQSRVAMAREPGLGLSVEVDTSKWSPGSGESRGIARLPGRGPRYQGWIRRSAQGALVTLDIVSPMNAGVEYVPQLSPRVRSGLIKADSLPFRREEYMPSVLSAK